MNDTMNDTEVWSAIDDQRRRTADLLDQLSEEEWRHASLCPGWTVRDVAAHLTLQELRIGDVLAGSDQTSRHPRRHESDDPAAGATQSRTAG